MNLKEFLGKAVTIKIDRPMGSRHPKKGFIYPINYGFIPNTKATDGDEIDAYVLGVFEPIEEFTGLCIAIVHRQDDDDDKIVLAPKGKTFSDEQIMALTEFQERFFKPVIIR
ncbi:MAG: inorganic diphosphatase [Candidatus Aenigmatarchaeota archaeon]